MDTLWFTLPVVIKSGKNLKDKELNKLKNTFGSEVWDNVIGNCKIEIFKVKSSVKRDIDVIMCNSTPLFFCDGKSRLWFPTLQLGMVFPRMYNPIVVSFRRWKVIENNPIIKQEDVYNEEKPFQDYPPFDHTKPSFVFFWIDDTNSIIGPVGIAIPTNLLFNSNTLYYPQKSLAVISMTRGRDYFCQELEARSYDINEFLNITNLLTKNLINDDVIDNIEDIKVEDSIILEENEDEKLNICFLTATKYLLKDNSLLPIDLGLFFQQYVQKCMPNNEKIDLKKTSYKKLLNYIKKLNESSEEGDIVKIINIKDKQIMKSVKFQSKLISDFEPIYGIPSDENKDEPKMKYSIRSDCYFPTRSFRKFFDEYDDNIKSEDNPYDYNCFKNILLNYIEKNKLTFENDKVILNSALIDFLEIKKNENAPQSINSIVNLMKNKCSEGYIIKSPDNLMYVKKGKIPKIKIHSEKMGSKEVTVIRNLEPFHLLNNDFTSNLKHHFAASAGIHEGKKRATGETVVHVQGNQTKLIKNFLKINYGLEEKYILIE
uniref:SUI1 domain-containing protein n=1 Tax=Parastrongyloides trichosuri TaxID=131310 RepID=A0A0N4ZT52_PARTI